MFLAPIKKGVFSILTPSFIAEKLEPAHKRTILRADENHFSTFTGMNGTSLALKQTPNQVQGQHPFEVVLTLEQNGNWSNEVTVKSGLITRPEDTQGPSTAPLLHEPHVWPNDTFPVKLTGLTLDSIVFIEILWEVHRELVVDNLGALDSAKYNRHIMQWSFKDLSIKSINSPDFDPNAQIPVVYDWAANTATTFVRLATIKEHPTETGQPVLTQNQFSDIHLTHPLTHDLRTKPEVAFPPGAPDGPTEDRPIVFHNGGTITRECSDSLAAKAVGYCQQLSHGETKVHIKKRTMFTLSGPTYEFHELTVDTPTDRAIETLSKCDDPLA